MHFLWQGMNLTYMLYMCWMFTFQHIFEAVYAAKNKRQAQYVLFENILDFLILFEGMIYITIVYKVYRFNTFLDRPDDPEMAEIFWYNWESATRTTISDQAYLIVIDISFITKAII